MKTTIEGFLIHESDHEGKSIYDFYRFDPSCVFTDSRRVVIGPCTVDVDVPDDFDPTPARIAILRKEKAKISAELTMKTTQIDAQINELLSIEHKVAA